MILSRIPRAAKVWRRNLDVFRSYYLASLVGNIGEPILYLFGIGLGLGALVNDINGMPYINFLAPGMLVATAMTSAAFECTFGSYTRMAEQDIFHAMLAAPLEVEDIALGEILWGATKSVFSATIMLAILAIFGIFDRPAIAPLVLVNMFVLGFTFGSIALSVSAVSDSYEFFNFFFTLFLTPLILFSGIYFPSANLPDYFAGFFRLFPPAHAVTLNRFLFFGGDAVEAIKSAVYLAVFMPVGLYVSIALMRRRLIPRH